MRAWIRLISHVEMVGPGLGWIVYSSMLWCVPWSYVEDIRPIERTAKGADGTKSCVAVTAAIKASSCESRAAMVRLPSIWKDEMILVLGGRSRARDEGIEFGVPWSGSDSKRERESRSCRKAAVLTCERIL